MKIDMVLPWVDGSDEEWLKEKENYFPSSVDDAKRYRDWDLLKYWFRSVEENAEWVNKIYFVTWGHVPDFLDINHPKLVIVNHKDYIDPEYLPTYSANPIELNFHKIKGLSDNFVYSNDDIFVIKKTNKEDFFEGGKPKDVAIVNPIVPKYYDSASNIMANDIGVINKYFNYHSSLKKNPSKWLNRKYGFLNMLNILFLPWKSVVGLYQQHLPSSLRKSTYQEIWEKEYDILHETSKRKKRNNFMDVNQWLIKEWQVMKGDFIPRDRHFGKYVMIKNERSVKELDKAISNRKVKVVCINDHVDEEVNDIVDKIKERFEKLFPNKSSFEK